jgi:UDP-glucuronate decarboxylase
MGNLQEITILELADKIIKLAASRSEIIFKPLPADDPRQRKPDITLAKEKLGWSPWASLEEGLGKSIAYFDTLLR